MAEIPELKALKNSFIRRLPRSLKVKNALTQLVEKDDFRGLVLVSLGFPKVFRAPASSEPWCTEVGACYVALMDYVFDLDQSEYPASVSADPDHMKNWDDRVVIPRKTGEEREPLPPVATTFYLEMHKRRPKPMPGESALDDQTKAKRWGSNCVESYGISQLVPHSEFGGTGRIVYDFPIDATRKDRLVLGYRLNMTSPQPYLGIKSVAEEAQEKETRRHR